MNLFKKKILPTDNAKLEVLSKKGGLLEIVSKLKSATKNINTVLTTIAITIIAFSATESYLLCTLLFGAALVVSHIYHNAIIELTEQGGAWNYAFVAVMFCFAFYLDSNATYKLAESTVTYKAQKTDINPNRSLFLSRKEEAAKAYADAVSATTTIDAQMQAIRQKWAAVSVQNQWTAAQLAKELKPLTNKKTAILEQAAQNRDNRIADADNTFRKQEERVNLLNDLEASKQEASEEFAAKGGKFISTVLLLIVIFCAYKEKQLNEECGVIVEYTAKEGGEIDGFDAIGYSMSLLFNNILISIGNIIMPKKLLVFNGEYKKRNSTNTNTATQTQQVQTQTQPNTTQNAVTQPNTTQNIAQTQRNVSNTQTQTQKNTVPMFEYDGTLFTYEKARNYLNTYRNRHYLHYELLKKLIGDVAANNGNTLSYTHGKSNYTFNSIDEAEKRMQAELAKYNVKVLGLKEAAEEAGYTVKEGKSKNGNTIFVFYYNGKEL